MRTLRRTLLIVACALPLAAQAQTVDIAGVKYPTSMQVGGQPLQLNGAGVRYKFVVRVYTAGLYLGSKATTPEAVLAAPGPKRLHVVMQRDIDANELGRLFTRGMQDNAPPGQFGKFIPGTLALAELFAARKRLRVGDHFSIDFVPGTGTRVLVNGKPESELITEPEFFNGLLRIWLGNKPADETLKDALLGKAAPAPVTGQN
jgi:hypothetical protein